jgi:tetratricopeptide (TPR) repeat protein
MEVVTRLLSYGSWFALAAVAGTAVAVLRLYKHRLPEHYNKYIIACIMITGFSGYMAHISSLSRHSLDDIWNAIQTERKERRIYVDGFPQLPAGQTKTLFQQALVAYDNHDYEAAIRLLRQCLGLNISPEEKAACLITLGNIFMNIGSFEEGLGALREVLRLEPVSQEAKGIATNNIAIVYRILGNTAEALFHHKTALKIAKSISDRRLEAASLNDIGTIYRITGQPREASKYYQQAIRIAKDIKDRHLEAVSLANMGNAQEEPLEALRYHQAALDIARETGDRKLEATNLLNIGTDLGAQGKLAETIDYFKNALKIAKEIGCLPLQVTISSNLGTSYDHMNASSKALSYFEEALRIAKEIGDKRKEAVCLYNIGMFYKDRGASKKGEEYLNKARQLFNEMKLPTPGSGVRAI